MSGEVNLVTKLWRSGRELARVVTDTAKAIGHGDEGAVNAGAALLAVTATDLALAAVGLATIRDPAQAARWCNEASRQSMAAAMSGDETAKAELAAIWMIEILSTVMTWAAESERDPRDPATKQMALGIARDAALLAMVTAKIAAKP